MEAAGFPGENTCFIIKAAQVSGLMPNKEKFSATEFERGVQCFVGYVLEKAFRSWCLSWWKSKLCRMWLRGEKPGGFQTEHAIRLCLTQAEAILKASKPSLPGWLVG
jgi:hypothetical protein